MLILVPGLIIFLFACNLAAKIYTNTVVHEQRDFIPKSWSRLEKANKNIRLPIRIGMKQMNLEKGHEILMDISHLNSANYGHYYSADEVADLFAPLKASVDSIHHWLVASGIAAERISESKNKQWMQFDASIYELEALLHTEYYVYQHSETNETTIVCERYHVPVEVKDHIDYITPGIKFFSDKIKLGQEFYTTLYRKINGTSIELNDNQTLPTTKEHRFSLRSDSASPEISSCEVAVTPDCIRSLYKIPRGSKASPNNKLGIFEGLGDIFNQEDLNKFYSKFAPYVPQGTGPEIQAIDGAVAPTTIFASGVESSLDLQMTQSLIYPQKTVLYQTGNLMYHPKNKNTRFLKSFLEALDGSFCDVSEPNNFYINMPNKMGETENSLNCGLYKPTSVVSISYGISESDLPIAYLKRQCAEFMKLGLQGVTIIFAAGDHGVAAPRETEDQQDICLGSGDIFKPGFPATCPYVTTVGATFLPAIGVTGKPTEMAPTRFGSGGGFSNIYPTPSYQRKAVSYYLKNNTPPYPSYNISNNDEVGDKEGIFNSAGRAYPDVSAVGENIVIYNKGMPLRLGGTSASAPIFASVLNLINEERLAIGKPPIGFVNPVLYANPQIFNDVTIGNSQGCQTEGFSAAHGWDPVTGLGTPNYPAMLDIFMRA